MIKISLVNEKRHLELLLEYTHDDDRKLLREQLRLDTDIKSLMSEMGRYITTAINPGLRLRHRVAIRRLHDRQKMIDACFYIRDNEFDESHTQRLFINEMYSYAGETIAWIDDKLADGGRIIELPHDSTRINHRTIR